jgi:hypothetical protein
LLLLLGLLWWCGFLWFGWRLSDGMYSHQQQDNAQASSSRTV